MPNTKIPWVPSPVLCEPGNLSSQEDWKPRASSALHQVLEHPGTHDVRDWISEKARKSRFLNNGLFLLSFKNVLLLFNLLCVHKRTHVSVQLCVWTHTASEHLPRHTCADQRVVLGSHSLPASCF